MKKSELVKLINEEIRIFNEERKRPENIDPKLWDYMLDLTPRTKRFQLVKTLTGASGYWYLGSGEEKLRKKLEDNPELEKQVRSETAKLVNLGRQYQQLEKQVKKMANDIIAKIEKAGE